MAYTAVYTSKHTGEEIDYAVNNDKYLHQIRNWDFSTRTTSVFTHWSGTYEVNSANGIYDYCAKLAYDGSDYIEQTNIPIRPFIPYTFFILGFSESTPSTSKLYMSMKFYNSAVTTGIITGEPDRNLSDKAINIYTASHVFQGLSNFDSNGVYWGEVDINSGTNYFCYGFNYMRYDYTSKNSAKYFTLRVQAYNTAGATLTKEGFWVNSIQMVHAVNREYEWATAANTTAYPL